MRSRSPTRTHSKVMLAKLQQTNLRRVFVPRALLGRLFCQLLEVSETSWAAQIARRKAGVIAVEFAALSMQEQPNSAVLSTTCSQQCGGFDGLVEASRRMGCFVGRL